MTKYDLKVTIAEELKNQLFAAIQRHAIDESTQFWRSLQSNDNAEMPLSERKGIESRASDRAKCMVKRTCDYVDALSTVNIDYEKLWHAYQRIWNSHKEAYDYISFAESGKIVWDDEVYSKKPAEYERLNSDVFSRVICEHERYIHIRSSYPSQAYPRLKNQFEAEDLTADTFCDFSEKWLGFKDKFDSAKERRYLIGIQNHLRVNIFRSGGYGLRIDLPLLDTVDALAPKDLYRNDPELLVINKLIYDLMYQLYTFVSKNRNEFKLGETDLKGFKTQLSYECDNQQPDERTNKLRAADKRAFRKVRRCLIEVEGPVIGQSQLNRFDKAWDETLSKIEQANKIRMKHLDRFKAAYRYESSDRAETDADIAVRLEVNPGDFSRSRTLVEPDFWEQFQKDWPQEIYWFTQHLHSRASLIRTLRPKMTATEFSKRFTRREIFLLQMKGIWDSYLRANDGSKDGHDDHSQEGELG